MRCPRGSDPSPARTCSATRADMKKPMPAAAITNGASCKDLSQSPAATGTTSGSTKYHRNNCTSRGTLRNSSTHAAAAPCASRFGTVRSTPIAHPTARATTQASRDTSSVVTRPCSSMVQ